MRLIFYLKMFSYIIMHVYHISYTKSPTSSKLRYRKIHNFKSWSSPKPSEASCTLGDGLWGKASRVVSGGLVWPPRSVDFPAKLKVGDFHQNCSNTRLTNNLVFI
jgi:hypothetical protein